VSVPLAEEGYRCAPLCVLSPGLLPIETREDEGVHVRAFVGRNHLDVLPVRVGDNYELLSFERPFVLTQIRKRLLGQVVGNWPPLVGDSFRMAKTDVPKTFSPVSWTHETQRIETEAPKQSADNCEGHHTYEEVSPVREQRTGLFKTPPMILFNQTKLDRITCLEWANWIIVTYPTFTSIAQQIKSNASDHYAWCDEIYELQFNHVFNDIQLVRIPNPLYQEQRHKALRLKVGP
jgi:hypothetical protein